MRFRLEAKESRRCREERLEAALRLASTEIRRHNARHEPLALAMWISGNPPNTPCSLLMNCQFWDVLGIPVLFGSFQSSYSGVQCYNTWQAWQAQSLKAFRVTSLTQTQRSE